jgi:hypothetical protein
MRLSPNNFRGAVWLAAACSVLAITAPVTTTRASQAEAAQKVAARRTVAAIPPHIQQIRSELSGVLVSIDPATGEFRTPTPEEHEALAGPAGTASRLAAPRPVDLPGGGSMVLTSAANIDFTTAVQGADGTITFRCTHGLDSRSPGYSEAHRLSQEVRNVR